MFVDEQPYANILSVCVAYIQYAILFNKIKLKTTNLII